MWHVTFVKTGNTCQCMWHLFMHVTPIYTLTPTSWVVQWSWFAWVNALCNLSCKKSQEVAASFQGQFLSSHCFMLCITVEVEPRIAKQYKCQYCCSWKLTGERGWRVEQKCLCIIFLADQKVTSSWKKCILGHEQQVIACCQTHTDYRPP